MPVGILSQAMTAERRRQPHEFSKEDALDAIRAAQHGLSPHIERIRGKKDAVLFEQDWHKHVDRDAVYAHASVISKLLIRNPSGIFKKMTLASALKAWDSEVGFPITKGRAPDACDTAAMGLINLIRQVAHSKGSSTTGTRTWPGVGSTISYGS